MPFSPGPVRGLLSRYASSSMKNLASTTETSIWPAGVGSTQIDAGWFQPGYNARVIVRGTVTTPLVAGTTTIRLKNGATTLLAATTSSLLGGLSGPQPFAVIANIQCYTAGSAGSFGIGGEVRYPIGLAGLQIGSLPLQAPTQALATPITMNTIQPINLDLTAQWSGTNHSLMISVATLELMSM